MFARVTTVDVAPSNVDQASAIYQSSIIPDVSAAQGNLGAYLLVDRATGHTLSVTLWDSQANALAYEASGGYRAQVAKVAQFFTSAPGMATYDVLSHT
jgi:quinol monooxygenase YgiN